jgi:hypothetical protein
MRRHLVPGSLEVRLSSPFRASLIYEMDFIAEEFSCGRKIVSLMITVELVISAALSVESYGRGVCVEGNKSRRH